MESRRPWLHHHLHFGNDLGLHIVKINPSLNQLGQFPESFPFHVDTFYVDTQRGADFESEWDSSVALVLK
jgi:hypothetical protein